MKTTNKKFLIYFKLEIDEDLKNFSIDDRATAQDLIDESLNIYGPEVKRSDYSIVSFCPFMPAKVKTILRKAAR